MCKPILKDSVEGNVDKLAEPIARMGACCADISSTPEH